MDIEVMISPFYAELPIRDLFISDLWYRTMVTNVE
jgi:hypothetical protein